MIIGLDISTRQPLVVADHCVQCETVNYCKLRNIRGQRLTLCQSMLFEWCVYLTSTVVVVYPLAVDAASHSGSKLRGHMFLWWTCVGGMLGGGGVVGGGGWRGGWGGGGMAGWGEVGQLSGNLCFSQDWVIFQFMIYAVFDLISEHTLLSGHILCWLGLLPEHLCVLAVLLCCIMQSIFYAN